MDGAPALLILSLAIFGTAAMLSLGALRAWRGWLALRQEELAAARRRGGGSLDVSVLRERVRRLEAIAGGADL